MNYKSRKYKKVKKSKKNITRGGKRSHKKHIVKKSKLGNRNYQKQPRNGIKKNISYYLSHGGKAKYSVLRNEKSPTSYATPKRVKKTQLKKYRKPFGKHNMKDGGGAKAAAKQPKRKNPTSQKITKQKDMRKIDKKSAKNKRAFQKQKGKSQNRK